MQYLTLLLALLIFAEPAYCFKEVVVKNVKVDERAENSVIAKNNAIKAADKEAFFMLACYLHPQSKPMIGRGISHDSILQTITKFQIIEEQISPTRYKATLIYYFNLYKVTELLANHRIEAYSNKYSKVLVLPILQSGSPKLWETAWFYSWQKLSKRYSYLMPEEDLENITNVKLVDVLNFDVDKLITKYKAQEALIISASYKKSQQSLEVIVNRPLSKQKKVIRFLNVNNNSEEIFMSEVAKIMLEDLYDNLQSTNISLVSQDDECYQIMIKGEEDFEKVTNLLKNYRYVVQYISDAAVVIEIRTESEARSAESGLRKAGYGIIEIGQRQWVISKHL